MKIADDQAQQKQQRKTTFEPAAAVGGMSIIFMSYVLLGLVTSYRVSHILPFFLYRGFLHSPGVTHCPRIILVGFLCTPSGSPPPPIPLGTTDGGCPVLPTQL